MRVYTGEYTQGKVKGIFFNKKHGKFFFLEEKEFLPEDFSVKDAFLSLDIPNIIMQVVETPPITENSALEFIIKNKLSAQFEEDINKYKIIFTKNEKLSTKDSFFFNVFLIEKTYIDNIFPSEVIKNLELLTISAFSLTSYSQYFKDLYLLHFYTDEKRAVIALSINGVLEYVRYTNTPEYVFSEEDLKNFYYEAFNLSYIFLRQNRKLKIDLLLLTGNILSNYDLIEEIYRFSNLPVFSLNTFLFVENIDVDTFQKNIIPIGNLFLSKDYDIRDKDIIFYRNFIKISKYVVLIFLFINVFLLGLFSYKLYSYNKTEKIFEKEKNLLFNKSKEIARQIKLSPKDIDYYTAYLTILNKEKRFTFSEFVNQIKPILLIHNFENFSFQKGKDKTYVINLKSKISFDSITTLYAFKEKIERILKLLPRDINVKNSSTSDLNKKMLKLDITLVKKVN